MDKNDKHQSDKSKVISREKFDLAKKIAEASPLFSQLINELSQKGFPFDLDESDVLLIPKHPEFVHLSLRDTRTSLEENIADLLLTIDLKRHSLIKGEYMVTQGGDKGLDTFTISSTGNQRKELHEIIHMKELEEKNQQDFDLASEAILAPREGCSPSSWKTYGPWYGDQCHNVGACICNGKIEIFKCKVRERSRRVETCYYYNRDCHIRCNPYVVQKQTYEVPCMLFGPFSCNELQVG